MKIFYYSRTLQSLHPNAADSIGFVPTMGALHAGHLALIEQAAAICNTVVVSIFVNPRQFNNPEDLKKYPRQSKTDLLLLSKTATNSVFIPSVDEVYAQNTSIPLQLAPLDAVLEGEFRPGHFQGVVDVLHSLFDMVKPTDVFFGLKDLQQCMVVEKLIEAYFPKIHQHNCTTLREESGLAMSSRNMRLSEQAKNAAANIYKELSRLKTNQGTFDAFLKESTLKLAHFGIETEYMELVDLPNMGKASQRDPNKRQAIVFAGYLEGVRLIDNILL
ncbi:MAG: pantoate--beta-alanine ligase [Bacteroidia bacterium]|nr:pantoate--beta-alanine ligase [Bacteroidia bacterium]